MEEYKEVKIGSRTFRVKFKRSFRTQCELLRLKRDLFPDDIIKADCEVLDLDRDEKGKVIGKKFFPVTDEILEEIDDKEGLDLYEALLRFRFKKKDKKKEEPKALKSSSKKNGSETEDSNSNMKT